MEMQYRIILGALGVLLLISQITLIAFKLQEKRETRKLFEANGNPGRPKINGFSIPGFANICIEHAKKLVKIETCLTNIVDQRKEDREEEVSWKAEIRDSFKRVFNRIEK